MATRGRIGAEGMMGRYGSSPWCPAKKQTKEPRVKAWPCYSSPGALGKRLWFSMLPAKAWVGLQEGSVV